VAGQATALCDYHRPILVSAIRPPASRDATGLQPPQKKATMIFAVTG